MIKQIAMCLAFTTFAMAQIAHNTNIGLSTTRINAGIGATAHYSASYINIPYHDSTSNGIPTFVFQQYNGSSLMEDYLFGTATGRGAVGDLTKFFNMINVNPYVFSALAVLEIAKSSNTEYRTYTFEIPVSANYIFNVDLKGDIDSPHNKFNLYKEGLNVFNVDEYLGSNSRKIYTVYLQAGRYTAVVGLGSGSLYMHTAGNLVSIEAYGDLYWTSPYVIAENSPKLTTTLPNIGSSATVTVSVPPEIIANKPYPISFGQGTVYYSDFHAMDAAFLSPCRTPEYKLQQIVEWGGKVWFPNVYTTRITFDGRNANYTVKRSADEAYVP